jgi:hypothetical protein
MDFTPKYVTADDYFKLFGIELSFELRDNDNAGEKVAAFIYRNEKMLETFLQAELYRIFEFDKMTIGQQDHFKHAVLEQMHYMIRNGDISSDSGYEPQQGLVTNPALLKGITIAPNAIRHLTLAGLWTRKLQHGFGWFDDFFGW